MVDIHHHLLWGLDDGPKDLETSIAMAKASAENGVTHVVCTPHSSGNWTYNPDLNEHKLAELRAALEAARIPLTLGIGCDFHLSYDNILDAKANPARYSINHLGYVLVELPDYGIPRGLTETFYELQLAGLTPILTHPERNPTLQADYATRLSDWMRGGVLIQITADSVLGKMGKTAQKMAHELLAKRWVHFLATDAHNVGSRPPRLADAHSAVAKKYGQPYADSLVLTNPRAVFNGKPFTPAEEPEGLYEDLEPQPWWKRLLGK
jgi:protein-tyrosine phosphatase